MSKKIPDELIDSLTQIYSEIQSGETFYQSIHSKQLPQLKCPSSLILNWIPLRDAIIEGKSSALETLKLLIKELRSQKKILNYLKKKSQGPLVQLYTSSFCCLALSSYLFLNASNSQSSIKLSANTFLLSLFMQTLAIFISLKITSHFKNKLNYLEWIQFMSRILLSIKWGQSLTKAYIESRSSLIEKNLPSEVQFNLILFENYLRGQNETCHFKKTPSKLWGKSEQQLKALYSLHEKGNGVSTFLKISQEDSYQEFQHYMEEKSENTSLLLLIPLFSLQVPSFFIVLIHPLWESLNNF